MREALIFKCVYCSQQGLLQTVCVINIIYGTGCTEFGNSKTANSGMKNVRIVSFDISLDRPQLVLAKPLLFTILLWS